MLVVSGGIPIDDSRHFEKMNAYTRVAAATARYAPSLMEMIGKIALSYWKKKGTDALLRRFYKGAKSDLELLTDRQILPLLYQGLGHLTQQGLKAFVLDGGSIMKDWQSCFEITPNCRHWLHGENDPVVHADYVARSLQNQQTLNLNIVPEAGQCLLHRNWDLVLEHLSEIPKLD